MVNRTSFALLLCCLTLVSCGRKQRTIFQFSEQETVHISKLALPAVQALKAERIATGVLLTWKPLEKPIIYIHDHDRFSAELDGYHVYKLSKNKLIPKNSLTKKPILTSSYTDRCKLKKNRSACYLVRPVFKIQNQTVLGISSAIACIQ